MSVPHSDASTTSPAAELSPEDRSALLALARHTIAAALRQPAPGPVTRPVFARHAGAFVTVHVHGELRGCIGIPEATRPVGEVVTHCAAAAAFEDPRFPSIRALDLGALEIEISVLTPLERLTDLARLWVGRHGLVGEEGSRRGVLLRQVGTERGWSPPEFRREPCRKAGLPADAWQHGAAIWTFEAEVFSESGETKRRGQGLGARG